MGQPNDAGRLSRIVLALSLLVAGAGWLLFGLPSWAVIVWFVVALVAMIAGAWHHRRRDLRPLERSALDPKQFRSAPSAVWAGLTLVLLVLSVPVIVRAPMWSGVVPLSATYASRHWAWKVASDRTR